MKNNVALKSDIPALTGVRGLAALLVVVYHFAGTANTQGLDTGFAVHQGYLAVDLFFILSGFVIALSYQSYFAANLTFAASRKFFFKRLARLYPAYAFMMVLYLIKAGFNFTNTNALETYRLQDIPGNLLMLTGWGLGVRPVISDSWSVSTEVAAYLLFPFLIRALAAKRAAGLVLVGLLAVGGWWLTATSGDGVKGPMDVVANDSVIPLVRCIAGFCFGILAFIAWSGGWARRVAGNAFTAIVLGGLVLCYALHASDLIVLAWVPLLIIALAHESNIGNAVFGNPVAVWLGNISYSLYLVHIMWASTPVRITKAIELRIGWNVYLLATIIGIFISCLVAWASYRWVEMPGKQLILNLTRARRA